MGTTKAVKQWLIHDMLRVNIKDIETTFKCFFFKILVPFIRNSIVSEGLEKLNCGWEGTSKTFVPPSYCLLVQKLIILTKTIKAKTNKQKH